MRICIGGYAGCGNMGDDAILQAVLSAMPAGHRVTVLTGKPRLDSRRFGVPCVGRMRPFAVRKAIRECDRFLCGGGSLLQNETGMLSLVYYLSLLRYAQRLGRPTVLLAAGIGPIKGKFAEAWVLNTLRSCCRIELRDRVSLAYLLQRGIDSSKLHPVEDPALKLELPPLGRLEYLMHEHGMKARERYFCAVLRPPVEGAAEGLTGAVAAELQGLRQHLQAVPVFPILDPADRGFTLSVAHCLGGRVVTLREPSEGLAWIGGAVALVSMRLHGLIFACRTGTPAIGLSSSPAEPKLRAFCEDRGMPHLFLREL